MEFKDNRMRRWPIQRSKRSAFGHQFDQGTLPQFGSANIHLCLAGPRCCFGRGVAVRDETTGRSGENARREKCCWEGVGMGRVGKDVALELG